MDRAVSLWWCRRRTWARAMFFAFAAYLLLMLPLLGFLPATYMTSYSFIADQRRYAALVAPVTLVTARAGSLMRRPVVRAGVAAVAALLLAAASRRCWPSEIRMVKRGQHRMIAGREGSDSAKVRLHGLTWRW